MHVEQVEICKIWDKVTEIGLIQVHMARFGSILNQNRSHRSRMPPIYLLDSKTHQKLNKSRESGKSGKFPYFPYSCGAATTWQVTLVAI